MPRLTIPNSPTLVNKALDPGSVVRDSEMSRRLVAQPMRQPPKRRVSKGGKMRAK